MKNQLLADRLVGSRPESIYQFHRAYAKNIDFAQEDLLRDQQRFEQAEGTPGENSAAKAVLSAERYLRKAHTNYDSNLAEARHDYATNAWAYQEQAVVGAKAAGVETDFGNSKSKKAKVGKAVAKLLAGRIS